MQKPDAIDISLDKKLEKMPNGLSLTDYLQWMDDKLTLSERARFMGRCYQAGDEAYRTDPKAKKEIEEINKKVYEHTRYRRD